MMKTVWGSEEFDEVSREAEHAKKVEEDKQLIDDMLSRIQTAEGERYLIGVITGH